MHLCRLALTSVLALLSSGCFRHLPTPAAPPGDARGGHAPSCFDPALACGDWRRAAACDESALSHVSFPELDPRGCFIPVRYTPAGPRADAIPPGCGYPSHPDTPLRLLARAAQYRALAEDGAGQTAAPLPREIACRLPPEVRRAVALTNARTLERLASLLASGRRYPYGAVATFGFGHPRQNESRLLSFRPGQPCPALDARELQLFGVNVPRARRARDAFSAGVAPVVLLSGGAVHARLYEAFMLHYLSTCQLGVRPDAVLLDPCADHTHTNVRNTGALLKALDARTAYLVTDDGLQAAYLQDWSAFSLIGGSIDQRALRDFGYLLGSYRQASVGIDAGFWYTPYRFWAEPEAGLGSFTCVDR